MVHLPRYAALKSRCNNNYLRCTNEASPGQTFLKYSGDEIFSPHTKFELEQAKADPSLVHIRCCYNNKYLVSWSEDRSYIVAGAEQKEEDRYKWTCTLFRPVYFDTYNVGFRFRHAHREFFLCLWRDDGPRGDCLRALWPSVDPNRDLCDLHEITDWELLLSIPKYIAFKGDNGCYLRGYWNGYHPYLQFSSSDIRDSSVVMETFLTKDGSIRIKSNHFGRFWRLSPNWIWADSTDTTSQNIDTLFWPVKVDSSNVIALRSMSNKNYVKRLTADDKTSCLNAAEHSINFYTRLEMVEPVFSRKIYNVNFRLSDARIYDQTVMLMATATATNKTQASNTVNLKLSYTDTKSSTWTSSISMKLGIATTIETGVPFIADGKIEVSAEFSGGYEWGKTKTSSKTLEIAYDVSVPPMTTIIVSLLATKGTCDIPYSYTQCDSLYDGRTITYDMDDGVYHSVNCYNFKYETKPKAI
ncbi:uncharacterized protein LOC111014736 [Momordica charantia]|uniref:Uncharacterized protein LOC111014736 n=1 Tax=Momordica charantia TaxID=3673 RepID=A0A6J1CVE2_MOMCH|nr:uncharacterized protein LOC111014736 [Momordica charantia]